MITSLSFRKLARFVIIFSAILSGHLAFGASFANDPLFSQMEGHWTGHGNRIHLLSGRQTQVDVEVTTTYEEIRGKTALLSQNRITETDAGALAKTYLSNYWIRPSDTVPGGYELGLEGSTTPSSSGVLGSDAVFKVEQDFGGGSTDALVDRSQTQFFPDRTVYSDVFTQGTQVQTQTQIEYRRD